MKKVNSSAICADGGAGGDRAWLPGDGSQLHIGLSLVGLCLLMLVLGMTVAGRNPRRRTRGGARAAVWRAAARPSTGTRARP